MKTNTKTLIAGITLFTINTGAGFFIPNYFIVSFFIGMISGSIIVLSITDKIFDRNLRKAYPYQHEGE